MRNPLKRRSLQKRSPGRRRSDADSVIQRSTLYTLFMQAPAIICVLRGPDHVFELVNPGYQRLFNERPLLGRSVREAIPEADAQGYWDLLDRVYATGESYVAREAPVTIERNGRQEQAFFNFIYQPMYSQQNQVDRIVVFAFEVTDEVRARRHNEERLKESEEFLRLLIDSVQDYAISMLDQDGRVVSWNSGARRIEGYEPDEIVGRHFSMFYPEEDVRDGKPDRLLALARERGRVEDEGWRVRRDGTRFFADVIMTAIHDADGNLRGFAKITRDVTERQKAEETERALAVAQEVNRAKDEFLAVISHELRTPLTSILGWARMLRMGGLDEATTEEALDALERSAQAQVHLIEDLLDDTRIASGKLKLSKRPLELRTIIESALDDLAPAAQAKNIRLVQDLVCDRCPVVGDPTRLQQVVWNLVSNAIKFTPEDGAVFVRLERLASTARIEVRDTGRGIAPDLLPQLFQRFRQGDPGSDRKAGVGLGLAISKYLVEEHGGSIKASSEGSERGAMFTVELPLTIEPSGEYSLREPDRAEAFADLSGVRVLVIEDEADNSQVLATVVEQCGGEVKCAEDVAQALATFNEWRPDVLVCDIALPGGDGCELLKEIRKTSDVPAVAVTVFGSGEEEARVRACGFQAFRQKPIEPADLAHDIERLARRSAEVALEHAENRVE